MFFSQWNILTCATSSKSSCLFWRARALWRDFPTPVCLLRKASPWFSIQSNTWIEKKNIPLYSMTVQHKTSNYPWVPLQNNTIPHKWIKKSEESLEIIYSTLTLNTVPSQIQSDSKWNAFLLLTDKLPLLNSYYLFIFNHISHAFLDDRSMFCSRDKFALNCYRLEKMTPS